MDDARFHARRTLRNRARSLRKAMTRQEVKLWLRLKAFNKEHGSHFRRQAPLDGRIADFAEFGARLIVEVDGGQHGEPEAEAAGRRRDAHFARSGFRTLRFWNSEIDEAMDGVCGRILEALGRR